MKLSVHWLQQWVDVQSLGHRELSDLLTLHTAEVEEIESMAPRYEGLVLGQLLGTTPHPSAPDLMVAEFDLGPLSPTGPTALVYAPKHDLTVGHYYLIATPGTTLPTGQVITTTEVKGVPSHGMLCDCSDLGLKSLGLFSWADGTAGQAFSVAEPVASDTLIDIENKTLTHRPDLMGHTGFVRELGALLGHPLPTVPVPSVAHGSAASCPVDIQTDACRRFMALTVEDIKVEPSPVSYALLLEQLGTRAISNLVDVTNLVLLGHGQPMHCFDADRVEGKLIVRQAREGESLVALDGETYPLTPADTVIADETKILSIAGVMGGLESGVTDTTTRVIFEVANFDPVAVRRTSARLGLRSESSMRFEKSLDPEQCPDALAWALHYLGLVCPSAQVSTTPTDAYPHPVVPHVITLSPARVRSLSGLSLSTEHITQRLVTLGFGVEPVADDLHVTVPSWRATKDITLPEDLVEEIVRMEGLSAVPSSLPALPTRRPRQHPARALRWQLTDYWAQAGYHEMYGYSFHSGALAQWEGAQAPVTVLNPLSENQTHLRQSLLTSMVPHYESTLRSGQSVTQFQLGRVYAASPDGGVAESARLAVVRAMQGQSREETWQQLVTDVTACCGSLGLDISLLPAGEAVPPFAHPQLSAVVQVAEQTVGQMCVIHPQHSPLASVPIITLELDLDVILSLQGQSANAIAYTQHTLAERDLSCIVPERTHWSDIYAALTAAEGAASSFQLLDTFRDAERFGPEAKNVVIRCVFSVTSDTTESSYQKSLDTYAQTLVDQFQATIRS